MRLVCVVGWGTSATVELDGVVCGRFRVGYDVEDGLEKGERSRSRIAGFAMMIWQVHVHRPQHRGILKTWSLVASQTVLLQAEHDLGPRGSDDKLTISLFKSTLSHCDIHISTLSCLGLFVCSELRDGC